MKKIILISLLLNLNLALAFPDTSCETENNCANRTSDFSSFKTINMKRAPMLLSEIIDLEDSARLWPEMVRRMKHSKMKNIGGSRNGLYEDYRHRNQDVNELTRRILRGPIYKSNDKLDVISINDAYSVYYSLIDFGNLTYFGYESSVGGGCFGRATYVHFELLNRGFNPQNIRKIWGVSGKISGGYNYHVATMVPDENGSWLVIDNVLGLVDSDEWMSKMLKDYDHSGDMIFLVTVPERLGPGKFYYTPMQDVSIAHKAPLNRFGDYFIDMLDNFEKDGWKSETFKLNSDGPLEKSTPLWEFYRL